jgi:vacuolar-type H+-ATPase subunit H
MVAEKSLLQLIREKELMLSIKIDETRREAEEIIRIARKEAADMIETSHREGNKAAQEYHAKEMEKILQEIQQLRDQGNQQAMSIRAKGERNLQPATEKIVKLIFLE